MTNRSLPGRAALVLSSCGASPKLFQILLLLVLIVRQADAQSLGWAKQAGGGDWDFANAVAVDSDGNSYITGPFNRQCGCGSQITFDPGGPNQTTLPGVWRSDVFVAKYDSTGALIWATSASTADFEESFGIAVDAVGNSYVALVQLSVGPVVMKFDSNGNEVWTRVLPSAGGGYPFAIAVNAEYIYVTGYAPDPQAGGSVITVWKLHAGGSSIWTRQATGLHYGGGTGIAVDSAGNAYITGLLFQGTATFGTGEPNETTLTDVNGAANEMFIAKYDGSGSLMWARQSADIPGYLAYGYAIKVDSAGDPHITMLGNTILGLGEPNETPISGSILAKYSTTGQFLWATSISQQNSEPKALAVGNSAIFVTGYIANALFTAKYDAGGNLLWLRQPVSVDPMTRGGDAGNGIGIDSAGNAYVAGGFLGTSMFGPGEPSETILSSTSILDQDIFIAKYLNDASGNSPPVADDQSVTTPEDTSITFTLTATDPDGDPLTYDIVAFPAHGNLDISNLPVVTYTPHSNYNGPDSFTFTASDTSQAQSNVATVSITVTPVNDAPTANDQALTTPQGTPLAITLTGQDVDGNSLLFNVLSGPSHGTLMPPGTSPNRTYTPNPGYTGADSFSFEAHDGTVPSAPATVSISVLAATVGCGTLTSGVIATGGQVGTYTFAGQAGQMISLALASTGGFATNGGSGSAALTLLSPTGTIVGAARSNGQVHVTLPVTGTYTIRVSGVSPTRTGSYNLNIECLFPPSHHVPVVCGTLVSDRIEAPADVDLYSFQGQVGQIVSLALASTGGFATNGGSGSANLAVFGPTGAIVGAARSNGQVHITLPVTGTYVVHVAAVNLATVGSYNINFECLRPPSQHVPLVCGTLVSGRIEAPADVDLYSFPGQAGQIVSLALASTGGFTTNGGNGSVNLAVFGPTGAIVGAARSNGQVHITLPATGTYVVHVAAVNLATVGSYNMNFECLLPPSQHVPLVCGTLVSDRIEAPADVDLYSFQGQMGQIVSLALASTGGFATNGGTGSANLAIFGPTGAIVAAARSNGQVHVTLPATGTYVVHVAAVNLATVGSYNINFECLFPPGSNVVPLSCGATTGAIEAPADADLFSIQGQANQVATLSLTSTGGFATNRGTGSANLAVFAPTGAVVGAVRSNGQVTITLPVTGTYVLHVAAVNLATVGTYTIGRPCF